MMKLKYCLFKSVKQPVECAASPTIPCDRQFAANLNTALATAVGFSVAK